MNHLFQIRMTPSMGRGVFALQDLEPQKKILQLNQRKYITYSMVAQHSFFGLFTEEQEVKDKKAHFAFYMAFAQKYKKHQKIHSVAMVKYISELPPYLHSLVLWSKGQLSVLQDENLVKRVNKKRQILEQKFFKLKDFLINNKDEFFIPNYLNDNSFNQSNSCSSQTNSQQKNLDSDIVMNSTSESQEPNIDQETSSEEGENYCLEFQQYKNLCKNIKFQRFLHFYSAIESRNIYHTTSWDPKPQIGALISVLELFNHSPKGQVEKKSHHLQVTTKISKGQQIFLNYGDYNNSELLFLYGCVIDEHFEQTKDDYVEDWVPSRKTQQLIISEEEITKQRTALAQRYNSLVRKQKNTQEKLTIEHTQKYV